MMQSASLTADAGRPWAGAPVRSVRLYYASSIRFSVMTEQQPIVFIIDDDPSVRDAGGSSPVRRGGGGVVWVGAGIPSE